MAGLPAFVPSAVPGQPVREMRTLYYGEIPDPSFYFTGVTFSNLGQEPVTALASLHGSDGTALAQAEWAVAVRQQITREIWTVFAGTPLAGASYLKVQSPAEQLGFELYLTRDPGQYPFQFDGLAGQGAGFLKLVFPMAAPEAEWASRLRLVNLAA